MRVLNVDEPQSPSLNTTVVHRHTIIASFDRWGVKGQGERMAALEAAGGEPSGDVFLFFE